MATTNPNRITSQDVDWSNGTNWSVNRFLRGDGTWNSPLNITLSNTIFVAKNGNDSTALANRLDLPFLTLDAARTAALTLSPTSTNRILIKVFSGYYTEKIVLANFIDWDLGNCIIDLQTGDFYTIDDDNIACDSIIYGSAKIIRSTEGTLGCIRTQNPATNFIGYFSRATSSRGETITCTDGNQDIYISSSLSCTFSGTSNVFSISSGNQNITMVGVGTISNSSTSGRIFFKSGGTSYIRGNMFSSSTSANRAITISGSGNTYIYGNLITSGGAYLDQETSGIFEYYGNMNGCNSTPGVAVNLFSGTSYIKGNIDSDTITIGEELSNNGSGIHTIEGNISSTGSYAIIFQNSTTATLIVNNSIISSTSVMPVRESNSGGVNPNIQLNNCRIISPNNTDVVGNEHFPNSILILNNCTLISTLIAGSTTGNCIEASTSCYIYGGCQANCTVAIGATQLVGTIIVDTTNVI